jgi:hypothetical protein
MGDYSADFFRWYAGDSRHTAEVVVPLIIDLLHPDSAIDIGWGTGEWLAVMREHGVDNILGIDGDWIPQDQLCIPTERFLSIDLRRGFHLDRTFALAICAEVAEHLPAEAADGLVSGLTRAAPVLMFSAAIPGQGGTGHINEQWPGYWLNRFAIHDFVPVNYLRPRLWNDPRVAPYLAQNLILLVSRARLAADDRLRAKFESNRHLPMDVVHPAVYLNSLTQLARQRLPRLLLTVARFAKRVVVPR